MISEETRIKLDEIHEKYINDSEALLISEAKKSNPYKVGDIIQDHYQIIKIDQTIYKVDVDRRYFRIVYKGIKLTKKLKPFKSGEVSFVYKENIKNKLS